MWIEGTLEHTKAIQYVNLSQVISIEKGLEGVIVHTAHDDFRFRTIEFVTEKEMIEEHYSE